MFNSLVFTLEINLEVTFGIFSVLVSLLKVILIYICFTISYDKNVKIVIILDFFFTFQSP